MEDDLGSLKVAELKELCKGSGLKVGGKKDDLIQRIRSHRAAEQGEAAAGSDDGADGSGADRQAGSIGALAGDGSPGDGGEWLRGAGGSDVWDDNEGASDAAVGGAEGIVGGSVRYMSTRGHAKSRWRGRLSEAVREGQPFDGGLLVPTALPDLRPMLPKWAGLSFPEVAVEVAKIWMGKEWDDDAMPEIFGQSSFSGFGDLRDPLPVRQVEGYKDVHVLELFHGPTGAPQDSVARPLANLVSRLAVKRKGRAAVITGWSNPLESLSVAAACRDSPSVSTFFCAPLDMQVR